MGLGLIIKVSLNEEQLGDYWKEKFAVVATLILGGVSTALIIVAGVVIIGLIYCVSLAAEKLSIPIAEFMHRVVEFCHKAKKTYDDIILISAVETRNQAQLLDSPGYLEKLLITNKVTTNFFNTPCKSIIYTTVCIPTAEFRIKTFYRTHQQLIHKVITMTEVVIFQTRFPNKHGLGWEGPNRNDPSIDEMVKEKKIYPVDQTRWLYSHSDMLSPSDDLMENVYEKVILSPEKGIKLGNYKAKKKL